ncbi:MAG TPA: phosphate ABC transporter substrate-binding protein PstS [Acetobacteraceae bacterium]|jgi:phosphate transport system substrate-binding protein
MRIAVAALAIGLAGFTFGASAQQITGAGATFPAPVYTKWGEAAKAAVGIELNYQAIGSGGGQNQILNRTVDFGASDAPMDAAKLVDGKLLQFPTVMGAVVIIINLPDVKADEVKLTGEVLAEIFSGTITKWNDPKLAALNPGVKLPSLAIAPVHRADGSGTSFVFTSYLSAVSPDWKSKVGASTSVNWPAGAGAKGNDGVAATTKNTRGGIGYVENAYATQNKLITTQLRNKAGKFIAPTMASFEAAATNGDWKNAKDFAVNLIDQPGDASWPIVSATFILLPKDPKDPARSANVMKFFDWAYKSGDSMATSLEYIHLPDAVKAAVRAAWHSEIKGPDGKPVM